MQKSDKGIKREKHLNTALTANAKDAKTFIRVGHLELIAGNPEKAKTHLHRALKMEPKNAEAHYQNGLGLLSIGPI